MVFAALGDVRAGAFKAALASIAHLKGRKTINYLERKTVEEHESRSVFK
jgi:hypothetical protein